jgi:serine/threonine protein kinase
MSNSITSQTPLPHPIPSQEDLGPLVGKNFGGYEITSYIGEGPTGAVYRAEDMLGSRMAVKVMHQELSRKDTADALWSDLQKLNALAGNAYEIKNPHLIHTHDAGFGEDGQFFYSMDELVGCDLESGLEESGALTPKKALEIVRQVCMAIEAAHAVGVVHGGLKPRNVFLCPRDTELVVKVLDFGAARLAGGVEKGVIVGNPFYMAPEQFGGAAEPRTDVYALGVMMYELFSGTLPFAGPSHGQVMMRHLSESPPPPPGVDAQLSGIILRALAKTPGGRFPSVKQLRDAVEKWAKSQPRLEDIVAREVVSRAQEAREMKQAALTADNTAQMPKSEVIDLARATGLDAASPKKSNENPNSSESVEASLEDFISQANASFPTSDGWDLHTGDVELIDEPEVEDASAPKPLIVKPRQAKVDEAVKKSNEAVKKNTSKGIPAIAQSEPAPVLRTPSAKMPVIEPPPGHTIEPAGGLEELPSSAPPRRNTSAARAVQADAFPPESTDVVSQPLPRQALPWTANPLVIIGGLLAAFIIGALVVFLLIKNMTQVPPQMTVTTPAPQVAVQPPNPVVTPLQPTQPVVVPLGQPAAAQPAAVQPAAVQPAAAQPAAAQPVAAQPAAVEPAAVPPPAEAATPKAPPERAAAPHPKKKKAAAPEPAKKSEEKPAAVAAPKKEPAKKSDAKSGNKEEKKGGGDWVDPFAQ